MDIRATVKPVNERVISVTLDMTETEIYTLMLWLGQTSPTDRVTQLSKSSVFRDMPMPNSVVRAIRSGVSEIYSALDELHKKHFFRFRIGD
jgi:hypothetical protein